MINNNPDPSSKPFEAEEDTLKGKTGGDEYLKEAGSNDEVSSTKFIKDYEKEATKQRQQKLADIKQQLKDDQNTNWNYEERLAEQANQELAKLDWPDNWRAQAFATNGTEIYFSGKLFPTEYGFLIIVRNNQMEFFYRAFRIEKNPDIDYQAMKNFVSQAENMIDDYKKLLYSSNPRTEGDVNPVSK